MLHELNYILFLLQNSALQHHTSGDLLLTNGRIRSIDFLRRPRVIPFKSQSYRVTRMLILVSTCFLVLNAPSHICAIGLKLYTVKQPELAIGSNETLTHFNESLQQYNNTSSILSNGNDRTSRLKWVDLFYIMIIITQHISYASYSINFFLYSFCGIKFRRELLKCMSTQRRSLARSYSPTP